MHHELLKLHNADINGETDPVLHNLHEAARKITFARLSIRELRYEITEDLRTLDQKDQGLDRLLDRIIQERLAREEELRVGSNHGN